MRYVLDTNILLFYLRQSSIITYIDTQYQPFDTLNDTIISVVSVGELRAIAKISQWGKKRIDNMNVLFEKLLVADINSEDIIERYAEIDSYSQGKLANQKTTFTSRNMGKNDLWIAATTSVLGATLLTSDFDFEHLNNVYFSLAKITL